MAFQAIQTWQYPKGFEPPLVPEIPVDLVMSAALKPVRRAATAPPGVMAFPFEAVLAVPAPDLVMSAALMPVRRAATSPPGVMEFPFEAVLPGIPTIAPDLVQAVAIMPITKGVPTIDVLMGTPFGAIITPGGQYNIYRRAVLDSSDVLADYVIHPVTEWVGTGFAAGSEQWYQVRAETVCGVEDIEPVRLVRVAFDGAGNLILPVPNAPVGLRLVRGAGGAVTAIWSYLTTGQADAPAAFNIYVAEDDAALNLGSPADTVSYFAGRRRFEADLGNFADGTLVRCVVRAEADSGAEETNLVEASIIADAAAPEPASSISVEVEP